MVPSLEFFLDTITSIMLQSKVNEQINLLANTDLPICIHGAVGTGKTWVARTLHQRSQRAKAPFHTFHCASLSSPWLDSALLGHRQGAFIGAKKHRQGVCELSQHGTLFLEDVTTLPVSLQNHILQMINHRTCLPVGANKEIAVDVRFIFTCHDQIVYPPKDVESIDRFIQEISLFSIYLPTIKEQASTINHLLEPIIQRLNYEYDRGQSQIPRKVTQLSAEAQIALNSYTWPGNLKELVYVLYYAYLCGQGTLIRFADLPPIIQGDLPASYVEKREISKEAYERQRILKVLAICDGHKGKAAEMLQMSRSTLWRKLKRYQMNNIETISFSSTS